MRLKFFALAALFAVSLASATEGLNVGPPAGSGAGDLCGAYPAVTACDVHPTSPSATRTNLGATTVGSNLFTLANPSAVTFARFNADNTVTARSATDFRSDIGLGSIATQGASSVSITGGTVSGLSLFDVAGHSSFGAAAAVDTSTLAYPGTDIDAIMVLEENVQDYTAAWSNGLLVLRTLDATANNALTVAGIEAETHILDSSTENYGIHTGGWFDAIHEGSGTVAELIGSHALAVNGGNGIATAAYAHKIGVQNNGGGSIVTGVGLQIDSIAGTTNWGLKQTDTTADNALAGNTRVGSTVTPTSTLDVTGTGAFSGAVTVGGNFTLSGSGPLILADFSNATLGSRAYFKSSTTNGNTFVGAVPNGTAVASGFSFFNNPDPANGSYLITHVNSSTAIIDTNKNGSGTVLPLEIRNTGAAKITITSTTTTLANTTLNITATNLQRNGSAAGLPRTFTATYDPGSLAAGSNRCDSVTVTGITTTGGAVVANSGIDQGGGCVMQGVRACAADTVCICWRNVIDTITACDPSSSTWTFTQSQ